MEQLAREKILRAVLSFILKRRKVECYMCGSFVPQREIDRNGRGRCDGCEDYIHYNDTGRFRE